MVSWEGLGGLCPPQKSPLPVPCPCSGRALPLCLAPNFVRIFFREGGLRGRSRFNHFKKFAPEGQIFEMVSWGGLGGLSPLRNLRYPCLAPQGGLGGFAPQESPLPVPCPRSGRALPPLFLAVDLATGRCTDGEKSKNELQASYGPKNLTI